MADFTPKKLQVFVSSTFTDLRAERQAAVEAILTAGHIPAGMELFTAGDESQMDVIKQWIDASDVFLLILGGRYGSIEPNSGKSYIQIEYEYAIEKGKPYFACVIDDKALDARVGQYGPEVKEQDNPQKLKEFRSTVLTKISKLWKDPKEIQTEITVALSKLAQKAELLGWVRPASQSNLRDEIARLSRENAQLRAQERINGLTMEEIKRLIGTQGATFLLSNAVNLTKRPDLVSIPEQVATDLVKLGFIEQRHENSVWRYHLTPAGRILLNRLLAESANMPQPDK